MAKNCGSAYIDGEVSSQLVLDKENERDLSFEFFNFTNNAFLTNFWVKKSYVNDDDEISMALIKTKTVLTQTLKMKVNWFSSLNSLMDKTLFILMHKENLCAKWNILRT